MVGWARSGYMHHKARSASGSGGRATSRAIDQVQARMTFRIHCPRVLGAIAQLVEHLLGRQGVRGSNPLSSTPAIPKASYSNQAVRSLIQSLDLREVEWRR